MMTRVSRIRRDALNTRAMSARRLSTFFTPSQTLMAIDGNEAAAMAKIAAHSFSPNHMNETMM